MSRVRDVGYWDQVVQIGDCWIWRGKVGAHGYGVHMDRAAHRRSYEYMVGEVPAGLELDHLCGDRRCVNPYHLDPVPHAINVRRGRNTRLSPEKVQTLRLLYATGLFLQRELAEEFGITQSYVSRLVLQKAWK